MGLRALFGLLLTLSLPAQAGPGIITPLGTDPVFNSTNLGNLGIYDANGTNRSVTAINFTKSHPTDTAGKWTAAVTVYDLATSYGGAAGNWYVIMGQYDTTGTTPTFTPNTLGNAMNNTAKAHCFGLMIEPRDGLFAAVDWSDGIYVSWRKDNKTAFPALVLVTVAANTTPLPTGRYHDAAPAYVDNKLKLFYGDKTNNIIMRDLVPTFTSGVLTKAELQANPTKLATLSIVAHSPTPIIDKNGNTQGLWMGGNSGSDSDMFFMPSLNPADTPIKVFDNAQWMNNGGVCGGRLFCADNANTQSASVADAAFLLGSNTALGGTATMTLGCRNQKSTAPVVSRLALSLNLANGVTTPLPIPGWNGSYALAGPILLFTNMVGLDRDETAHWNIAVPNDTTLKGLRIAIQGLSAPQGVPPTLTNTSHLEFR